MKKRRFWEESEEKWRKGLCRKTSGTGGNVRG